LWHKPSKIKKFAVAKDGGLGEAASKLAAEPDFLKSNGDRKRPQAGAAR